MLLPSDSSDTKDVQADAGGLLRAAGLRSTPQRRAILAAFRGGPTEHLSADEVYARAAVSVPDLGRGTVYATLAEFTETGLLAALGAPEPVRYETNTSQHAHFRCQLCLRVYDVDAPLPDLTPFTRRGHSVDSLDLRADGFCSDCRDYESGLRSGVRAIAKGGASTRLREQEAGAIEVDTPVGRLVVAATDAGVARIAFPEHGDCDYLRGLAEHAASARINDHLTKATEQLGRYFRTGLAALDCPVDWQSLEGADSLQATVAVGYGSQRSYHLILAGPSAKDLGRFFGANPIAILSPCHRVGRGSVMPDFFVGGPERRTWLLQHERDMPLAPGS